MRMLRRKMPGAHPVDAAVKSAEIGAQDKYGSRFHAGFRPDQKARATEGETVGSGRQSVSVFDTGINRADIRTILEKIREEEEAEKKKKTVR
ncbi:MAG: hypothetical protein V1911_04215 [Candidatus Micrarchaeota archaeon]